MDRLDEIDLSILEHLIKERQMKLHWKILISLILSFIIGLWSNISVDQQTAIPAWFTGLKESCLFVGTLFLNGLKMVVIPLVVTSIICGVAKIGSESGFGRLGLKTIGFYALTGFFAVCTGLLCVNLMNPGIVDEQIREKMLSSPRKASQPKLKERSTMQIKDYRD